MGHLSKHALVPAPAPVVFRYVADLRNAPRFIAAITRVMGDPAGAPAPGQAVGALGMFMGQSVPLTLRILALEPNTRVVIALEGDPAAVLTVVLEPDRGGRATRVGVLLEAPSIPGFLLTTAMGGMLSESLKRLAAAVS